MKLRCVTAMVLMAIMSVITGVHPASAAAATPAVTLLKPTSSTQVDAGATINVAYGFKNVISRPYVTLYFRKNYGMREPVNLNVATDYITVPSTWTPGTYRLDSVVIESIDNSKGQHFRNYLYIGTDASGHSCRSYTHLNLALMDVHVTSQLVS